MGQTSTCSFTLSRYADNTCTTLKPLPWPDAFHTGSLTAIVEHDYCFDLGNTTGAMKWNVCDPSLFLGFLMYEDSECVNMKARPAMGFAPDVCVGRTETDGITWYKLENLVLDGNKFGIDWRSGWSIFICQTML